MKRYYCTKKRGQVVVESDTTIISTDDRVINFFETTPEGYIKAYTADGFPFNELIPFSTQAEINEKARLSRINEIDTRLNKIDILTIRSLRTINSGRGSAQDDTRMIELDDEVIALRVERAILV